MVTPPPNNHPYSSGKVVVNIVQLWHRDAQPGIMQRSNQIISCDRHDSSDHSAHKSPYLFCYTKIRDWDNHWMVDMSCCSNHATVRRAVLAGALPCWNTNGWYLSPSMFTTNLMVYSLHHNVLPTLQSSPLMTNGPFYPITQGFSCHGQHTMPQNPWSFPMASST